jgi:nucleoside phosphorylase
MEPITFADCRAAARTIRASQHGRQASAVVRPRSVLGIVRARGPLSVVLCVAAAEGRFVRLGPDSFALLERPMYAASPSAARGRFSTRLLRVIDRRWDVLLFAGPPILLLAVTGAIVLGAVIRGELPPFALVWLPVLAMAYVAVFMTGQVVYQSHLLRRVMGRRLPTPDELAAESYPGWNWSMPLCHHAAHGDGRALLRLAGERMAELVRRQVRQRAEADGAEPDRLNVREVLVCLTRGVTTDAMRATVAEVLIQPYGPGSQVALRLPAGPVRGYREPVQAGGGFFLIWVTGVAAVVAMLAWLVATWEQQSCGVGDCRQQPTTYLPALRWLAWRLLWHDPPGIVPRTAPSLIIGWLLSGVGLMTVPVAWVSAKLTINAHKRVVADFERLGEPLSNTRILLLTVTSTERDAVLAAFPPVTGREPEWSAGDNVVVYELGSIGRVTVGMVQCARHGAGGPGGAQATATEAINRWRPDHVIMVGTCYGLREDWAPPQKLTDVVVATAIYDLDQRIQYDDRAELIGDRVSTKSGLVARLQAASTGWNTAGVWFGLLLSSQILVDSAGYRAVLKRQHSRALGGEMEAQGLYAAAADAGVPWIVVKAVSDWGVDREAHYRPAEAAANAAAFVVHAVTTGAFDRTTERSAGR